MLDQRDHKPAAKPTKEEFIARMQGVKVLGDAFTKEGGDSLQLVPSEILRKKVDGMDIFGVNWQDVLIVNGSISVLYESQTNVKPVMVKQVRGYPSGFV